ncbi:MAG: hypothetical protein ACHQ0J_05050 [Candidatus Dormibacterales bacterium]
MEGATLTERKPGWLHQVQGPERVVSLGMVRHTDPLTLCASNSAWPDVVVLLKRATPPRALTVVTRELEDRRAAETERRVRAINQSARELRRGYGRRLRRMARRWGHQ